MQRILYSADKKTRLLPKWKEECARYMQIWIFILAIKKNFYDARITSNISSMFTQKNILQFHNNLNYNLLWKQLCAVVSLNFNISLTFIGNFKFPLVFRKFLTSLNIDEEVYLGICGRRFPSLSTNSAPAASR